MFNYIKRFVKTYKLIDTTKNEILRLEQIIKTCHSKKVRLETYKKLIGVRGFFKELTGKSWKSQIEVLKAKKS